MISGAQVRFRTEPSKSQNTDWQEEQIAKPANREILVEIEKSQRWLFAEESSSFSEFWKVFIIFYSKICVVHWVLWLCVIDCDRWIDDCDRSRQITCHILSFKIGTHLLKMVLNFAARRQFNMFKLLLLLLGTPVLPNVPAIRAGYKLSRKPRHTSYKGLKPI